MNFPSIDIQGSVISADLLGKIRAEQATFQQGKDFNKDFNNAKLKDEISLAWQDAKGQWTIFNNKLKRVTAGESAATETRSFWILPLLSNFGYDFQYLKQAEEINGKSFWINNRDNTIGGFPLFIAGYHESIDKRPENRNLRVSPHAMVQEYLNYSENLYGLVTNGKQLRLLRDASRLTRLSYVEFNLEKIMEEDLYSDFVILYRLLHKSRMPQHQNSGGESIIEKYHQEGLEAGATIRNKLGSAVKNTIKDLANAFINHPDNTELRNVIANGNFNADDFYRQQLRIIYRLLFLFVIEERNLVYAESKDPQTKRFNRIYFSHYSLLRLRKLAKRLPPPEAARHYDLWMSLVNTFSLFESKLVGEQLGIMSLQGDLFSYNAIANDHYDLHQCRLSNAVLLQVIKALGYFENEKRLLIAVNYGGLDVEEFGSVYEGLLELKLKIEPIAGSENYSCTFDESTERSSSGSHYTPEELVQPLIKHSLDYIIEDRLKTNDPVKALLEIKVCDVACGSGHILLSAARKIAIAIARVQTKEEQPNPKSIRKAMRDVIRHCIYGVDKNLLAVELCKVAFWLEAHNPGEPLNFLDHHIKCGDAIVGLAHKEELEKGIADEAFKELSGDNKQIAKTFRDQNIKDRKERASKSTQLKAEFEKSTENSVQEAMAEYKTFNQLPETTPDDIECKAKAYKKFIDGKGFTFLKAMADTQVAQFFIPKTEANKDYLMTDADFRLILSGYKGWQDRRLAKATAVALEQRFFHWFIEFPQIFDEGGFDCVLGNPPFLGGKKISGAFGDEYLLYLYSNFPVVGGLTDLVAYFIIRDFKIINTNRYFSIITTNSVCRGETKESGLKNILKEGGVINYAVKNQKWPGDAQTHISLFAIKKGILENEVIVLNNKIVNQISDEFEPEINNISTYSIFKNKNLAFIGSYVLGEGFVIDSDIYQRLTSNYENRKYLYKYINGDDFNNDPTLSPPKYIINFGNLALKEAEKYESIMSIIKEKVYPERQLKKDKGYREKWWQHGRPAKELYHNIKENPRVLCRTQASKHNVFEFLENGFIYDQKLVVFKNYSFSFYSMLNSSIHELWFWRFSGDLGGTTLNYSPTFILGTFPFTCNTNDDQEKVLEKIGKTYHENRKQLMLSMQLGLTKTYNLFHSNAIIAQSFNDKDKQVASLQKHIEKTANTISIDEAIQGILKLRELHVQMDEAVLDAYGWNDIALKHDFYEVDYLPENDRVRYTIHPDARKEILKRLLELNHKIHEEEVAAGLWDKKKGKRKTDTIGMVNEDEVGYGLFKKEE